MVERKFISKHQSANYSKLSKFSPSHCAVSKGNLDCVKSLIRSKANFWLKNKRGDYPVHETIQILPSKKLTNEYPQILSVIEHIFQLYPNKINIQNDEHRTPLHLAASLGDIDACALLIRCGARINSLIRTSSVSSIRDKS